MDFIDINKEIPDIDERGNEFLVKIKTITRNEYEVAEWFDPLGGDFFENREEHEKIFFNINYKPYDQKIIGWIRIHK